MVKYTNDIFIDSSYSTIAREIYIASFCTENGDEYISENGLLSQWRAYGKDGGFAIVFQTDALEKLLESEYKAFNFDGFLLADVIYSDDDTKFKLELFNDLENISVFQNELFKNIILESGTLPESCLATDAYTSFANFISRYKHRGFKEEQEVRVAAMPIALATNENLKSEKERKFRFSNGRSTPYMELFKSLKTALPIEIIIVGPHIDSDSRATALQIMLRNSDIEVTTSEIPL